MPSQNYILPRPYRVLAFIFFVFSLLILVSVIYLIWSKVIITIIPNTTKVNQELIFAVKEGDFAAADNAVKGKIITLEVEGQDVFLATGSKTVQSDVVGEVTITNNYTQDQTLVETTRLADPNDLNKVLLRLKKTVTVLAGKQIKVPVYPANADDFKEIKPMKFVIPGLWGPLREKIYAENSKVLTKGGYGALVVTEADLTQAEQALKEKLRQKALADVNQQLVPQESLWPKLVSTQVQNVTYDAQVGQEAAEFTASMKLKAITVVFDENELISLARKKLQEDSSQQNKFVNLDSKSFSYSIQGYDLDKKEATVKVSFAGLVLAGLPDKFDRNKLLGLSENEIKSYFSQFPEVKAVEVEFHPGWLKKTPRLQEKIEIEIAQ